MPRRRVWWNHRIPAEEPPLPAAPTRSRRLVVPALWFAVILGLSSVPASGFERLRVPVDLSVLAHVVEYGVLGATLAWALEGLRRRVRVSVLAAAVGAAVDEVWQSTVPGRDASGLDWGVDVAAAAVGAVLLVRWLATAGRGDSDRRRDRRPDHRGSARSR